MKFFKEKWFIGVLCFALGGASMFGVQKLLLKERHSNLDLFASRAPRSMDPLFDQFFNDDFFDRSRDPFEEMRQMRERMMRQFEPEEGGEPFDSWFQKKFGGGKAGDIRKREDEHFVYYDILIEGLKPEKVNINVENGQLSVSGQIENKSEENHSGSYFSSTFHRSFPVPTNVDSNRVQMEQIQGKIIVKFPKIEGHQR